MKKIMIGESIIKSFQEGNKKNIVLNELSVTLEEGEFVSVMGPSGSGKSTLMFALSGMDGIDSGKIIFDGNDLSVLNEVQLSDIRRKQMGFIFQEPTFLKNLNILDNIILPSMRDHRKDVEQINQKARMLMKKTGITGLEDRDITQVSGGQLQRVGICRALMNNPYVIFGDEPTGALNSKSAQAIMDLLSQINKEGTTMMLVTHDPKVAAQTERILFMCDGKIVSEMKLYKSGRDTIDERVGRVAARMRELGI